MKKISKETLEIIESRSTTDYQSQEFTRKRDNLLTKSWKDFEIKDLKPNLIPNGWDSFEPYGSGEVKFESDFNDDWRLQNVGGSDGIKKGQSFIKTTDEGHTNIYQSVSFSGRGYVTLKIKSNVNGRVRCIFGGGTENTTTRQELIGDNKHNIYEFEITDPGNGNFMITLYNKGEYELIEAKLSDYDNKHLVVEKSLFGNDLTRIKTFGGFSDAKLEFTGLPRENYKTISFLVNTKSYIKLWDRWSNEGILVVPEGTNDYIYSLIGKTAVGTFIHSASADDNLDFIASDPQIVEGDVANPALIVTDLDDGREHVQVYGATNDTKLVLKDGKGFVGENYHLTSTIQNKGIELTANTSIGDADIPKGDSKLDIQGDLKEQEFTIELGARNA